MANIIIRSYMIYDVIYYSIQLSLNDFSISGSLNFKVIIFNFLDEGIK